VTLSPSPAPGERPEESAPERSRRDEAAGGRVHPGHETLSAYVEHRLPEAEKDACEEHLSRCPACLALVRELWAPADPLPAPATLPLPPPRARLSRSWLLPAACLLLGVVGLTWGALQARNAWRIQQNLAALENQLAVTQVELASVHKENFLALAPSGVRSYFSGTTTVRTLLLPPSRGGQEVSAEALAKAEQARQILEQLAREPPYRGAALLDLASLDIAAGRMEQADQYIRQAQDVLGDTPEMVNLRAVWLLAQGDKSSLQGAEELLGDLTRQHSDYLPAWFNLALYLQQSFRDGESRRAWQEYLAREQRPGFRRAAEQHLAALVP